MHDVDDAGPLPHQPELAEVWLKRAVHLDPANSEVAALLEKATSALGRTDDTLQAQEALLLVNPGDAELHQRYVRLLAAEGHHDRVAAAVVTDVRVIVGQTTTVNGNLRPEFYEMEEYEVTAEELTQQTEQILVERPSQRAIILGKGGARLKEIGSTARKEIANSLGRRVHLYLHVKVNPKWDDDRAHYRDIGLDWVD